MAMQSFPNRRQRGVVLFLAIVVLAAMSLAAIGLMRSVLNSNRVSANLAFQQSAQRSAEVGMERAVAWLEQRASALAVVPGSSPPVLRPANELYSSMDIGSGSTVAYRAIRENPADGDWDTYWKAALAASRVNVLPVDGAGNQVSYMIHRLCANSGAPVGGTGAGCESSPTKQSSSDISSKSAGALKFPMPSQIYYRITVRVQGPRNAVSFSQAIVAI